ncbi:hypothetical protein DFH06DRAFT_1120453 [Mycena polygramma]|nr:hypothetical protein DFH06DRAFT_1120453 [Mycena polygramma]
MGLVERTVLLYPWGTPLRQTAVFHFEADNITLRDLRMLEANLYASPGRCDKCPKPHFRHAALPGVSFTVLVACPHHPDVVGATDDLWRLFPNRAVARLLPDDRKHQTCIGNLVVIKHAHPDGELIANQALPVLDIDESDTPHIDELVHILWLILVSQRVPCYDLDEIFANFTLEERALAGGPETSPPPSPTIATAPSTPVTPPRRRRHTPPPRYEPGPNRNPVSPPPPSVTRPAASTSTAAAAASSSAAYTFHSPTRCGQTVHWSEAAHATQGVAHSSVHGSPRAKRHGKKVAYVVFRGRRVGVCHTWAEAEAATSRVRFALHQGYSTTARADAAFEVAQANGWICSSDSWSPVPVPSSLAPKPWPHQTTALCAREDADPWYVVYCGVNPGIFATSVECALNVLGIHGSTHQRFPSFEEARDDFRRAQEAGEVEGHLQMFPCEGNKFRDVSASRIGLKSIANLADVHPT